MTPWTRRGFLASLASALSAPKALATLLIPPKEEDVHCDVPVLESENDGYLTLLEKTEEGLKIVALAVAPGLGEWMRGPMKSWQNPTTIGFPVAKKAYLVTHWGVFNHETGKHIIIGNIGRVAHVHPDDSCAFLPAQVCIYET
jgi:hypothetical protein